MEGRSPEYRVPFASANARVLQSNTLVLACLAVVSPGQTAYHNCYLTRLFTHIIWISAYVGFPGNGGDQGAAHTGIRYSNFS